MFIKLILKNFFNLVFLILTSFCLPVIAQVTVTYFHNDISGSPMAATNSAGNVVWKESYRPYGDKLRNEPASRNDTNKIGYAGSSFDSGTGLSYMGARYYDPVIGRFMGIDPVGFQEDNIHSFNRFAYANNNPYKFIDKNGKYAELVFEAMSLTAGFNSLINNMRSGNYGAAAVDGGGIVVDVIGAALPGVPGVAGLGIKASREAVAKYEVGAFDALKSRSVAGDGLDIHHAVQKNPAGQTVAGYNPAISPSIAVPRGEHSRIPALKGEYGGSARDLLAKDIRDLRNNTNAPNSSLRELSDMNKQMYPGSFNK